MLHSRQRPYILNYERLLQVFCFPLILTLNTWVSMFYVQHNFKNKLQFLIKDGHLLLLVGCLSVSEHTQSHDMVVIGWSGSNQEPATLEIFLLPLLLVIQQICCCLPPLAHVVEGRLFDYVVVVCYPAGVPVLLACVAINAIANVMACERKGPLNKRTNEEKIHFQHRAKHSPLLTPFPKWLTMLLRVYFIYRG